MKTLHLNLKKKWFDMVLSGDKKEEYREIKDYWVSRFVAAIWTDKLNSDSHKEAIKKGEYKRISWHDDYDTITFSNGYSKKRKQFVIEFKGIEINKGIERWGGKRNKKYFVINLGKIIKLNQ